MDLIVRSLLLIIFLQTNFHLGRSNVRHLGITDRKCVPYDYVELEERHFMHLLVIPFLGIESLKHLSRFAILGDDNMRHNGFLSCMWRDRGFQNQDGTINFQKVEEVLGNAIGKEVGGTGPGINLSRIKAKEILSECNQLGGITHGQKVVFVRNCVLTRIKKFEEFQN